MVDGMLQDPRSKDWLSSQGPEQFVVGLPKVAGSERCWMSGFTPKGAGTKSQTSETRRKSISPECAR